MHAFFCSLRFFVLQGVLKQSTSCFCVFVFCVFNIPGVQEDEQRLNRRSSDPSGLQPVRRERMVSNDARDWAIAALTPA